MVEENSRKKKKNTFLIGAVVFFVLFLLYIAVLIYIIIDITNDPWGVSQIIPGRLTLDLVILFIAPLVLQIIFVFISAILTPLFVHLANIMKFRKWPMGIKELDSHYTFGEFVSRGFYATLLAIALSMAVNRILFEFSIELIGGSEAFSSAAGALILTPISILLIFPAWFLEDSGIIFMKKSNLEELSDGKILTKSLDVRGVGNYFLSIIKGFAGITTPFLYIWLFIRENVFGDSLLLGILLIFEPFFLIGGFFFSFWIYIKLAPRIKRWLLKGNKYAKIQLSLTNS